MFESMKYCQPQKCPGRNLVTRIGIFYDQTVCVLCEYPEVYKWFLMRTFLCTMLSAVCTRIVREHVRYHKVSLPLFFFSLLRQVL